MPLFPTILTRKRERCSLCSPKRTSRGVVTWVFTIPAYPNRKSLLNHYLAGPNLTRFLPWISLDEWDHSIASSVHRLYPVNQVGFRFFVFVWNGVVHSDFRVDEMHLLLRSFVALTGVVAILPTSATSNVSPASGHYPPRLPVISQIYLDGLQ